MAGRREPVPRVRMYRAGMKHERYLTASEYRRLMDEGEADGSLRPPAVAANRIRQPNPDKRSHGAQAGVPEHPGQTKPLAICLTAQGQDRRQH